MFSGGAVERMTILALIIMPYISASIILQLGQSIVPSLAALKKEGEAGHRKMMHYTKLLTDLITIVQGYGIAVGLMSLAFVVGFCAVVIALTATVPARLSLRRIRLSFRRLFH